MSKKRRLVIASEQIEQRIFLIRGQRVMLDVHLAELYRLTTAALNQAVGRNRSRFPADFAFRLTLQEFRDLISQTVISNRKGRGGHRKPPWVFTEHGVAMLSSVLRSPIAVKINIEIMRAFIRLRRLLATPGDIAAQLMKLAETVQLHDDQIRVLTQVLQKMMEPPPEPKGRFGFHVLKNHAPSPDGRMIEESLA